MKSVLVISIALCFSGVALAETPNVIKRVLHQDERPATNSQTEALLPNSQSRFRYSQSEQFLRQPSQEIDQPLPTPGIPPSFLSFTTPEEKAKISQQRTPPYLDEDRNSIIQDSALAQPPPTPPQLDAVNIQQISAPVIPTGITESVISTGTAPAEGTVIGAPYLIAVHREIIRRYGIPVAKPYPVVLHRDVQVPIDRPVPYPVDKPYAVRVNVPQPYAVDRPYPVPVDHPYPVRVPHPVGVPVPRPVAVPVPHPVAVPVPQPIAVHVLQPVRVPVAQPVSVHVPQPVAVPVSQPSAVPVPQPVAVPVSQAVSVPVHQPVAVPFTQRIGVAVS